MGSGNIKIAWLDHSTATAVDTYGSKYFQQNVADVVAKAGQVLASLRQTCFIIGGVPFELANAGRQGQEAYTVLRAPADYTALEGAKTKAGVTIYQALATATGCQQFVFYWNANFTIGYL